MHVVLHLFVVRPLLSPLSLRNCVMSVHYGLCIVVSLLSNSDMKQKIQCWGLPQLIKTLQKQFPNFPTKNKLLSQLKSAFPDNITLHGSNGKHGQHATRDISHQVIEREVSIILLSLLECAMCMFNFLLLY